jgi:acyl carrier protein
LDTPYTGPRNEIEDKLVKIWQDLFAIEQIGIHDDFFELGGDSVMAAQSISRIKDNFDVDVHVGDIFEKPTIDELAESILSNTLKHLGDDDLHEIVTEMDEMSDGKTV